MGYGSLHRLHCLNYLHCLHLHYIMYEQCSLSTLFYFDCLGHQEFKNIAHDGRGGYIEFMSWMDGMDHGSPLRLLRPLEHLRCEKRFLERRPKLGTQPTPHTPCIVYRTQNVTFMLSCKVLQFSSGIIVSKMMKYDLPPPLCNICFLAFRGCS